MKILLWITFLVLAVDNCRSDPLVVETMQTTKSVITIADPVYGSISSGILKSHKYLSYPPNWNKNLTLIAPPGCGIIVAIRLLDLRPHNMDKLTLSSTGTQKVIFSNPANFRNRSYDPAERTIFIDQNGKLTVNFETSYGLTTNYNGFELTYTAYTTDTYCGFPKLRCWNGKCIADALKCDGHNHCGDLSEQKHCPKYNGKGKSKTFIIIGGVFVVVSFKCLVFLVIRKRRKSRSRKVIHQPINTTAYPTTHPPAPGTYYPPPYTLNSTQGYANDGYH